MIKSTVTSLYIKMRLLFILTGFAIIFYSFSSPEYQDYSLSGLNNATAVTSEAIQKEARGVVVNEEGSPLQGVTIIVMRSTIRATTDTRGRFAISRIPDGSAIIFSCKGYKTYTLPPLIISNTTLRVKMVKDPEYQPPRVQKPDSLRVTDTIISEK